MPFSSLAVVSVRGLAGASASATPSSHSICGGHAQDMHGTHVLRRGRRQLCFTERDEIEKNRVYVEESFENLRELLEGAKRAVSLGPRSAREGVWGGGSRPDLPVYRSLCPSVDPFPVSPLFPPPGRLHTCRGCGWDMRRRLLAGW